MSTEKLPHVGIGWLAVVPLPYQPLDLVTAAAGAMWAANQQYFASSIQGHQLDLGPACYQTTVPVAVHTRLAVAVPEAVAVAAEAEAEAVAARPAIEHATAAAQRAIAHVRGRTDAAGGVGLDKLGYSLGFHVLPGCSGGRGFGHVHCGFAPSAGIQTDPQSWGWGCWHPREATV